MSSLALESNFRITLTIDGEDWGVWDQLSGGEQDTNTLVYPPGNMGEPVVVPGIVNNSPITLSRAYVLNRDHDNLAALKAKRGKGRCVVKKVPLGQDKIAYGSPEQRSGLLTAVHTPETDSKSNTEARIQLTIQPGVVL